MPSRRLPEDFAPNEITQLLDRKRRSGERILDLTETNPTRVGLPGAGPEEFRALSDPRGTLYEPDPRGLLGAREALVRYYAGRGGSGTPAASLSADDLVLVASTSEAYAHLMRLLCDAGDEIVIPRPSYPLLGPLVALEDVRVESYRLAYHDRWQLDLESLEGAISPRTRAVLLVQPNNPTGSCLSLEEAARVESLCAERGIAIISDEVFGDFPWPPSSAPLPSMLGEREALTFVLGGLSKLCGMPQMKVAWIAAVGRGKGDALRGLEWIADLFLSVSTPAQVALPRLLEARHGFQRSVRERLTANLARLRALGNGGSGFRVLEAEGGWSAVLEAPAASGDFALEALRTRNVLVHPGHFYEIAREGSVVVSLLPEAAVFEEAVACLEGMA
ncbi:MAG: pyridoxal phosphate-dependent aminotransferase [Candidatus Eisenbacteria bacterium]|uniref:alanine transaminase n=1 Tax=Eiseniibacteriota bacterium TaxID=2212470 RepID=A0A538T162_UNCEI|nr:MAG: pyridoxal phosphate-dependent aminotransferase [Candidatus Eisenbacteria bacterium]